MTDRLAGGGLLLISMLPALVLVMQPVGAFRCKPPAREPVTLDARVTSPRGGPASVERRARAAEQASVLDVSSRVEDEDLLSLIELRAGEHVSAVGDVAVRGDLRAGALILDRLERGYDFVDLTLGGPDGERRLLVLRHRPVRDRAVREERGE